MGPPSYMRSVDQNVVTRRIPVWSSQGSSQDMK